MGQEVKNLLKGVSVGGDYIGGNSTVNNYYGSQAEAQREGSSGDSTVFLSYNWHDMDTGTELISTCRGFRA